MNRLAGIVERFFHLSLLLRKISMATTRICVGISGASGAGKTTVCNLIQDQLGKNNCVTLSCDNYYRDQSHLSPEERSQLNFDHPTIIDFDLYAAHIALLIQGKSIESPVYDFKTHTRVKDKTITIQPATYIISEGILVLHAPQLSSLLDVRLYVDADKEIFEERRLERDINERGRKRSQAEKQLKETVFPMFKEFVEPTKMNAFVIPNNEKLADLKSLNITSAIDAINKKHRELKQGNSILSLNIPSHMFSALSAAAPHPVTTPSLVSSDGPSSPRR